MPHSTTIADVINDRASAGMADLLMALADYFYCIGAGIIPPPMRPEHRDLLATIEARHRVECLAPRGWLDPPADELPVWLRASYERDVLDQEAPADWIRESGKDGRP